MNNGVGLLEQSIPLLRINRPYELNRRLIQVRFNEIIEIILVLNNARYNQIHAGFFCHLDSQMCPLVVVYSSVVDKLIAGRWSKGKIRKVDAVINSRQIGQSGIPVGIADRDIISVLVVVVYTQDVGIGKTVDSCQHRRLYQRKISQGQIVEIVVNQVELAGPLHDFGDMQARRNKRDL